MGFVADVLGVGKGPEKAAAAAGDAQVRAAQIGADTIREQQKQYREDSAPYAQAGQQGLASLLYGLTGQQMGSTPQSAMGVPTTGNSAGVGLIRNARAAGATGWKSILKNSARQAGIGQQPQAGQQATGVQPQNMITGQPINGGAGDLMRSYSFQDFRENPDYQFRLNRGMAGLESSAAARGGLMSGAALKSLNEFNRGTFDQQFAAERQNFQGEQTNRYSRLYDLARLGQNTVAQTGAQGASAAANITNQQSAAGQAQAGAILAGQNARQDRYSGLAGLAGVALSEFI